MRVAGPVILLSTCLMRVAESGYADLLGLGKNTLRSQVKSTAIVGSSALLTNFIPETCIEAVNNGFTGVGEDDYPFKALCHTTNPEVMFCIASDQEVVTADNKWVKLSEIKAKDELLDPRTREKTEVALIAHRQIFSSGQSAKFYRFHTSSGEDLVVSANHLLWVSGDFFDYCLMPSLVVAEKVNPTAHRFINVIKQQLDSIVSVDRHYSVPGYVAPITRSLSLIVGQYAVSSLATYKNIPIPVLERGARYLVKLNSVVTAGLFSRLVSEAIEPKKNRSLREFDPLVYLIMKAVDMAS